MLGREELDLSSKSVSLQSSMSKNLSNGHFHNPWTAIAQADALHVAGLVVVAVA